MEPGVHAVDLVAQRAQIDFHLAYVRAQMRNVRFEACDWGFHWAVRRRSSVDAQATLAFALEVLV